MRKLSLILFCVLILSCNDNPVPSDERPGIFLSLREKSCTEVWLNLKIQMLPLPSEAILYINDSIEVKFNVHTSDTLLYIDSLNINTSYNFKINVASGLNYNSKLINCTTLDTTSHNFTWYTWTFSGNAADSWFNDVFIVNQNNIYVVGSLIDIDISGTFQHYYPLIYWNGTEWELKELFTTHGAFPEIRGIWVVDSSSVYFSNGDVWLWDGRSNTVYRSYQSPYQTDPEASIEKLWGNSDSCLYGIGGAGYLILEGEYKWDKIETGIRSKIYDMWGAIDPLTNQWIAYCTMRDQYDQENRILKITERNKVESVNWNSKIIQSIWTPNGWLLYTSGEAIYSNKSGNWIKESPFPPSYTTRIRGNGLNDIVVCGINGNLGHYNGINWKLYAVFPGTNYFHFSSISIKEDVVVAVGSKGLDALIVMGIRN